MQGTVVGYRDTNEQNIWNPYILEPTFSQGEPDNESIKGYIYIF